MINVLYEDNHLIVVEKPVNIPVQSDISKDEDLTTMIKKYIKQKYNKPGNVYLGLVHRLDRPVGGIMVFAKTSKAAKRLTDQIKNHEIKKTYLAVLEGKAKKEDTLIDKLKKDHKTNTTIVSEDGKYAELSYKLLDYKDNLSLVKIDLKTGRSHQIRVQFSSRGLPIYADQRYNPKPKKDQIALFACGLEFKHPVTKELMKFYLDIKNRYPFSIFKK